MSLDMSPVSPDTEAVWLSLMSAPAPAYDSNICNRISNAPRGNVNMARIPKSHIKAIKLRQEKRKVSFLCLFMWFCQMTHSSLFIHPRSPAPAAGQSLFPSGSGSGCLHWERERVITLMRVDFNAIFIAHVRKWLNCKMLFMPIAHQSLATWKIPVQFNFAIWGMRRRGEEGRGISLIFIASWQMTKFISVCVITRKPGSDAQGGGETPPSSQNIKQTHPLSGEESIFKKAIVSEKRLGQLTTLYFMRRRILECFSFRGGCNP